MLAGGDENLGAAELVTAVADGFSAGPQDAQIGAGLGFGEAHGAGPAALAHFWQVGFFLFRRAEMAQAFVGAQREARIHAPGLIGAVDHLVDRYLHDRRQTLAVELGVGGQAGPASFHELLIGVAKAIWRLHAAIFGQLAALLVAHRVQWRQHLAGELAGFIQYLVDGVGIDAGVVR